MYDTALLYAYCVHSTTRSTMRLYRCIYNVIKVSNVNYVVILTAAHQLRAAILPSHYPSVALWTILAGMACISSVIACLVCPMLSPHLHTLCFSGNPQIQKSNGDRSCWPWYGSPSAHPSVLQLSIQPGSNTGFIMS